MSAPAQFANPAFASTNGHAPAPEPSALAARWERILEFQASYILSGDSANLMTLTAAIIASPFFVDDAPPLWLWVIANPSTGKSDTIRHAYGLHRFTEFRDELTAKALSSGFREGGKRAKSLLDSLHRKTLCTPDLASTFSKDEATVKAILGTPQRAAHSPAGRCIQHSHRLSPDPSSMWPEGVGLNNRPASHVVAIFLWLIALAQLLRVLLRVEVRAGNVSIPLWVSIVAFIVLAALGTWLWREGRE